MVKKFSLYDWVTPNTYNNNFEYPPPRCGVYIIVTSWWINKDRGYKVLYVGQSKNLKNRYENHEVIKRAYEEYDYVQFYFMECDNHVEEEKKLIKKYQPLYNINGK